MAFSGGALNILKANYRRKMLKLRSPCFTGKLKKKKKKV